MYDIINYKLKEGSSEIMRKTTKEIWNTYWTRKFEEQRKREQEQRRKAFGSLGYQMYR